MYFDNLTLLWRAPHQESFLSMISLLHHFYKIREVKTLLFSCLTEPDLCLPAQRSLHSSSSSWQWASSQSSPTWHVSPACVTEHSWRLSRVTPRGGGRYFHLEPAPPVSPALMMSTPGSHYGHSLTVITLFWNVTSGVSNNTSV